MEKNNIYASLSLKRILIILLICAYLLPVWLFQYFPTQDGPSHVYNSQVLREYSNPDYDFDDYYNLNLALFPDWLSHASLAILMYIFPPLVSEKIFLSIYIMIFPLCIFYFLNSVQRGKNIIGFMSFLFIYNYLFLMGFYNFAISVPLFFLALGYWWRDKESITVKRIIILNLILATIYFSHIIPYVVAIASISLLSILYFRKRVKKILITLCCMIPSIILLFNYLLSSELLSGGTPSLGFSRIHPLFTDLVSLKTLVSYDQSQQKIAYIVSAFMICLFIYTLLKEKILVKGNFFKRFTSKDLFLLLYFIVLVLYFIMPGSIGPGGWTNDRLAILASILILAWFREFDSIKLKRIFLILVSVFSLVNIAYIGYYCKVLNVDLSEYTSETRLIEKNKVVLPIFFDSNGKSLKVGIFVNAANYYCLDNGGINLGNYEVQFDYFPVKFKDSFQPPFKVKDWVQAVHWRPKDIDFCDYSRNIDYLVIWGKEDESISESVRKCYNLIVTNGRLKVYRPMNKNILTN